MSLEKILKEAAAAKAAKVEEVTVKAPKHEMPKGGAKMSDPEMLKHNKEAARVIELAAAMKEMNAVSKRPGQLNSLGLTDKQVSRINTALSKAATTTIDIGDISFSGFQGVLIDDVITKMNVAPLFNIEGIKQENTTEAIHHYEMIAGLAAENATVADAKDSTSNFMYRGAKIKEKGYFTYEAVEDADIDMLAKARQSLAVSLAKAWERMLISGDNSAAHMDADVTAATDARKGLRGARFLAKGKGSVDWGGAALSKDDMLKYLTDTLELGGDYMTWDDVAAGKIVFMCNPNLYNQMVRLDLFTDADKRGSAATTVNGSQIRDFFGIKIVPSRWMPALVNATGVVDAVGANNTLQSGVMFNTDFLKAYYIGAPRNGFFDDIEYDRYTMTSSLRVGFGSIFDQKDTAPNDVDATRKNLVLARNIYVG